MFKGAHLPRWSNSSLTSLVCDSPKWHRFLILTDRYSAVDDIIYEDDPRKFIMYVWPSEVALNYAHAWLLRPERCAHEGPCGPQSQPPCECYAKDVHCRRNCQCSMRCTLSQTFSHGIDRYNSIYTGTRRFKGCHCDDGTNACTHNHRCVTFPLA